MNIDRHDLRAALVTAIILMSTYFWAIHADAQVCDYSVHGHYICADS
jgi:hypothetical protein